MVEPDDGSPLDDPSVSSSFHQDGLRDPAAVVGASANLRICGAM